MPCDASERAFKIFTDAYGKAWLPRPTGLAVMAPLAKTEIKPLHVELSAEIHADYKIRLPPI